MKKALFGLRQFASNLYMKTQRISFFKYNAYYFHGQKLRSLSVREFLNDQPGKEGYWDSFKGSFVEDLDQLTRIN